MIWIKTESGSYINSDKIVEIRLKEDETEWSVVAHVEERQSLFSKCFEDYTPYIETLRTIKSGFLTQEEAVEWLKKWASENL